jgi:MerR family copper efflux transcriptional regulator
MAFWQQLSRECEAKTTPQKSPARQVEDISSMNVGTAARRSGLPAKTIRYYEDIGLILPARSGNGYRDYSGDDIHRLAFLRRARGLGFSIEACRQLMALYRDKSRASHDVREIARSHVKAIEEKVRELEQMRATLEKLIDACHGDERPDCPILDDMAGAAVNG